MSAKTLWVLAKPTDRYLRLLDQLPQETHIVVGAAEEAFAMAPAPEVVFCGMGQGKLLETLWPRLRGARWLHSFAAGLENVLFPELALSPVVMTNAKGVFGPSLGEFAIAAALYFAKDFARMKRSQKAHLWDPFEVDELSGATLGIVGYGGIGREAAKRAIAMGMRVLALRRHPDRSDRNVESFAPADLHSMLPQCDYLLVAAPHTPETRGMIGDRELRRLKPSAVLINVGRGPVVVEEALLAALREKRIKGAALDVFDVEPLPAGHPFYDLENVLLSPHCADHTPTWLEDSMRFFIGNYHRYLEGKPLENVVDKQLGY